MVKLSGFVKIYIPSLGKENLKIPSRFIQSVLGNWVENVALRDRYNNSWQVKVEMKDGYYYFKDGWTKFVDDNKIEAGDLIAYEYFSQGILDFKIHDRSACLTKGVGGHISKQRASEVESRRDDLAQAKQFMGVIDIDDDHCVPTTEDQENQRFDYFEVEEVSDDDTEDIDYFSATGNKNDPDYQPKRANVMDGVNREEIQEKDKRRPREDSRSCDDNPQGIDGSSSTSSTKKKRKRDCDCYGEELFRSGAIQQPKNPYFVTKKNKSRAGELHVPKEVIKAYNLQLPNEILIIDPKERKFPATRKTWSDGRTFYIGGWKSLCGINFVRDEDSCICELVHQGGDLCIRVSIVPPKGQQT